MTQGQSGKSTMSSRGSSASSDDDSTGSGNGNGIEHSSKLTVAGVQYEATVSNGQSIISVSAESAVKQTELQPDDIENLFSFFNTFYREQRRSQAGGSTDGRGQVKSPNDGRLRENR